MEDKIMKIYNVSWVEYHSVDVSADDPKKAKETASKIREKHDTCEDSQNLEIVELVSDLNPEKKNNQ